MHAELTPRLERAWSPGQNHVLPSFFLLLDLLFFLLYSLSISPLYDFSKFFLYVYDPPGIDRGVLGPKYMVEQMFGPDPCRVLVIRL